MKLMLTLGVFAAVLMVAAPAMAQEGGDVPPRFENVTFERAPYVAGRAAVFDYTVENLSYYYGVYPYWGDPVPYDPFNDIINERDLVVVTATIYDPDLPDEEFFERVWVTALTMGPPEPPQMRYGTTLDYRAVGGLRLIGAGRAELVVTLQLPELEGANQSRLRGLIDYDAAWTADVYIANDESPESGKWDSFTFPILAILNPNLEPPNSPPFADAGGDQTVVVGSSVVLDASRTIDGTNTGIDPLDRDVFAKDNLVYTWEWISGPMRVEPLPVESNPALAQVTLDRVGDYVYRVLVVDGVNPDPSTDSMTVHVVSVALENHAPKAVVSGPTASVVAGTTIRLDATGSSDPDGDRLTYRWRQTNERGGDLAADEITRDFQPLDGVTSPIVRWQATAAGDYYFRVVVTDPAGLADTQLVHIKVVDSQTLGVTVKRDDAADSDADAISPTTPESEDAADDAAGDLAAPAACGNGAALAGLVPLFLGIARWRRH